MGRMIARFCLVALFLSLSLFSISLRADGTDQAIKADMLRIGEALKSRNLDVVIDMMYTPVAEAEGGRDVLKNSAVSGEQSMQKKNFQITTFETVAPFHRVKTSVNDYVIIPVHVVTQIGIQCTDTTSFQLAIKPHGAKKWEYLNGTTITPELKSRFFPDLKDVAFPPVKNKLLR